jgi:hypothetical protein
VETVKKACDYKYSRSTRWEVEPYFMGPLLSVREGSVRRSAKPRCPGQRTLCSVDCGRSKGSQLPVLRERQAGQQRRGEAATGGAAVAIGLGR